MKRILRLLLITGILVTAIVILKNNFAYKLTGTSYGMQPIIKEGYIKNLFIGSSMFRQGLDINYMEGNLEGSSYILTYNGNQPVLMLMELEYLLDYGVRIENLYMDLYPYTAAAPPWISDNKILLDTNLAMKIKIWDMISENNTVGIKEFYDFFVSANNDYLLTYPISNTLISNTFYRGGSTLKPEGSTRKELDALQGFGTREGLNEAQVGAIKAVIALAKEKDMNITYIETPKYATMFSDDTYLILKKDMVQLLDSMETSYILAEDIPFDCKEASYFQDLIHLSFDGRQAYTQELVGVLP